MAIIKQITQYEAIDGAVFNTEAECDAHEFKLANGAEIDAAALAYANTVQAIDRARSIRLNAASEFLSFYLPWVAAGKPEVEQVKFDTPKAEVEVVAAATETAAAAVDGAEGEEPAPIF